MRGLHRSPTDPRPPAGQWRDGVRHRRLARLGQAAAALVRLGMDAARPIRARLRRLGEPGRAARGRGSPGPFELDPLRRGDRLYRDGDVRLRQDGDLAFPAELPGRQPRQVGGDPGAPSAPSASGSPRRSSTV